MQNIPQTLDLLILGNEPAGLWLLREYEKLFPIHAQLKKQQRTQPSLGWLKINGPFRLSSPTNLLRVFLTYPLTTIFLLKWPQQKIFLNGRPKM